MLAGRPLGRHASHSDFKISPFRSAECPDGRLCREQAVRTADYIILLGSRDDELCLRDIDAVSERIAFEIRIDERRNNADLGHAIPGRDVVRSIFHEQGDAVTRCKPLLQRPVGDAIGASVELVIGGQRSFEPEHDVGAVPVDHAFDVIGNEVLGIRADISRPFRKSTRRLKVFGFADKNGKEIHLDIILQTGRAFDDPGKYNLTR